MGKIIQRLLHLKLPHNRSAFLWGPRKVGKSYWIRQQFPKAILIDLLKNDEFADYASHPSLLRQRYQHCKDFIVIDEVQKIPALLDEVHWMIENTQNQFLLTGSSARKLKRGQANLLGGRAWRREMRPLSFIETKDFDLEKVIISGLLPPHFISENPLEDLRSYIADYLKEEIAAEAMTRQIPTFSDFLRVAAFSNSELLNYSNVARETGVSAKVVRQYFQILEDTLLGFRVPPWTKAKNRRMIETEKFYYFDVGVSNFLARRQPQPLTPEFGKSFEHFILMELKAYQAYKNPELPLYFWRTTAGQEVDFILGEMDLAIEIKSSTKVHEVDTAHLKILGEESKVRKKILVCLEKQPRTISNEIEVLPWKIFLEKLWQGEFKLS